MSPLQIARHCLAAATLVLAAGVVAPAPPASAADTAPDLGDFRLQRGPNDLRGRVEALDARLPKLGVQNLLLQANRQARFGGLFDPCNEEAFDGRGIEPLHWCFDRADTGTVGGADGMWHANAAHRLPVPNVQGAVVHDGTWYLSRSRGEDSNGHLVEARGDGSSNSVLDVTGTRWAGVGVEDLSYWPGQDAVWTVTEHPGKRALYSCPATAPPNRAGMVCGTLD